MPKGFMTSDELLASVKLRTAVPIAQITFQDTDILNFANEEIKLKIVPDVLSVKEEFWVTTTQLQLLPNVSNYVIPYRAIGNKVRHVFYRQSSTYLLPLAFIPIENINNYQASSFPYQYAGVYLQNNEVVMVPPVAGNPVGSLEMRYYFRPNDLVTMDRAGQITSIDRTTGTITLDQVPANLAVTSLIDFIQTNPPHRTQGFDVPLTSSSINSLTIGVDPADIPTALVVGDYVCSACETVIIQVPDELHVMVAQATACRILESLGDTQGLQNANAKLQEMEDKLLHVIDTRIEGLPRKAVNVNSTLSKGRIFRRGAF